MYLKVDLGRGMFDSLLECFVLSLARVQDVAVITMEQQVEASPERLAILIRALHLFRFALN